MFDRDFTDIEGGKPLSQEDREFLKILKEGRTPCNRKYAETRLNQLKRRLDRDPKYKKDYVAFVNDMIKNGYAEPADPSNTQRSWYIPHHGVYHPKKTDKIRVVFDCSAEFAGQSLNRHLLQGPDLTNSLVGVLCRFRQEQVAFVCDIEGMFHQVRVNEEFRDLLRFLWWDQGDTTKEPEEFRMRVHLFGATSSPGCANLGLKTTADDNESELGVEPAEFLRKNFYVDDGLKSVETSNEAISIIKSSREMCQKGGFRLHKFMSNTKEVIESVAVEDRAKGIKNIDLDKEPLPLERVLGVEWCIESDTFRFRITLKDKPLTRRGILSTVSSIYDPLGLAAPFLLHGKRILQRLCKEGVGWDDPIPDVLRTQWGKWRNELHLLEEMAVQRCYKPDGFKDLKSTDLHHFSDASLEGYGQCSYLRLVDVTERVHCSLVMGKSRVTPLKPVTIPRLELTAALVSVKASETLGQELEYDVSSETFWTDSKVVKGYIQNDARRFHTYVANRVQQIRDHTRPEQWLYVESKNNPADDASRGLSARELLQSSRWLNGPQFLWQPRENWIDFETPNEVTALSPDDKEVRKTTTLSTVTKESPSLLKRLEYFSDWLRATRSLAVCLRYLRILSNRVQLRKNGMQGPSLKSTTYIPVNVEEIQNAEKKIILEVQKEAFTDERTTLRSLGLKDEIGRDCARQRNKEMKKTSQLYQLDPFLDRESILRVGGRIRHASISDEVKHPAILPRKGHATELIIR
ncbi:hypothetical protein QZH41_005197 [Actinostola sp. cb2023]|nr:hypothetical protein QZH41_005197 [Actinostola sp. cb2023]